MFQTHRLRHLLKDIALESEAPVPIVETAAIGCPGDIWICYCGHQRASAHQQPFLNGMDTDGVAVLGCGSCGDVVVEGVTSTSATLIKKIIEMGAL